MAWIAALQGFVVAALSAYICNGIPPFLVENVPVGTHKSNFIIVSLKKIFLTR